MLLQPSTDQAVGRSTGLTDLMIPPALTTAEPVPEQAFSFVEILVAPTDLEELLLRPGVHASFPPTGTAPEPGWWVVVQSAIRQPQ
jgi:hypothetical protein